MIGFCNLPRNWCGIMWVPTGIQFELFVIGYPRDLHVSYTRFNGFFAMFPTVFNTYEMRYIHFRSKRSPQKTFLILRLVVDAINNSN